MPKKKPFKPFGKKGDKDEEGDGKKPFFLFGKKKKKVTKKKKKK